MAFLPGKNRRKADDAYVMRLTKAGSVGIFVCHLRCRRATTAGGLKVTILNVLAVGAGAAAES